ncbi:MAG: M23 family metallopeptidase [Thiomargarita sp.]|nr:M23 family metallopeptidase [Thiomargarita sp.]
MDKIKYAVYVVILLINSISYAGNIKYISFDGETTLTIFHNNCQLNPHQVWDNKLILPLTQCTTDKDKIIPSNHPNLEKIYWAQHDNSTVWVILDFLDKPVFEIKPFPDQYHICIPTCSENSSAKDWLQEVKQTKEMMFRFKNHLFQIPLQGMLIDEFMERSIGYVPKDIIRDGLPHFGSKRDDWKGKIRKHHGYDIYRDKINVLAAADGIVTKVRHSNIGGLYIKLHHGNELYSLYVHLGKALVKKNQRVKRGEVIGNIDGPSGNAIEAQLHFEIKPKNKSIDPLTLIKEFYQNDAELTDKINQFEEQIPGFIQRRNELVKEYLIKK